jgi:subtilisin family serine protease
MELELTDIFTDMDPRLQRLMVEHAERQAELRSAAARAATSEADIAVVARVRSPAAWRDMPGVSVDAVVGRSDDLPGYLVTGRVQVDRLDDLRQDPAVYSLKAAQPVSPVLATTTQDVGARPADLPPGTPMGTGVIVGVVDFGLDFANKNFRNASGGTRIAALWDQRGQARQGSPYGYGRLFTRVEINRALKASNPYQSLGYGGRADLYWQEGTHGTHVTDIAAGNGRGTGTPGVAPDAEIVFVDLAASDIPWEGEAVVEGSFGDSVQLLEALTFIFDYAKKRKKPCVINASLGTNGGPHDGSTLLEQGIDTLVSQAPGRAVVLAAGNSYADGIHAKGHVAQGGSADLAWDIPARDFTHNELEVWYDGGTDLAVEIIGPDRRSLGRVALSQNARVKDATGATVVFIAHRKHDPNNGDNVIGVFLNRNAPAGVWTVRLHGIRVADGTYHAWIERDDDRPSHFLPPHDNNYTLGSLSTGHKSLVVGAYNAHGRGAPICTFSSAGPTRDNRPKPELCAPGQDVWAARSLSAQGLLNMSGTSMATPAVTGVVALVLAQAKAEGRSLTIDQIRAAVMGTARKNPPAQPWDNRYGTGRIWAPGAVAAV